MREAASNKGRIGLGNVALSTDFLMNMKSEDTLKLPSALSTAALKRPCPVDKLAGPKLQISKSTTSSAIQLSKSAIMSYRPGMLVRGNAKNY